MCFRRTLFGNVLAQILINSMHRYGFNCHENAYSLYLFFLLFSWAPVCFYICLLDTSIWTTASNLPMAVLKPIPLSLSKFVLFSTLIKAVINTQLVKLENSKFLKNSTLILFLNAYLPIFFFTNYYICFEPICISPYLFYCMYQRTVFFHCSSFYSFFKCQCTCQFSSDNVTNLPKCSQPLIFLCCYNSHVVSVFCFSRLQ